MADEETTPDETVPELAITVAGERYELDALTLDEVVELEEAFDLPIEQIDTNRAKAIKYLVYFAKRRKDPSFTLEEAGSIKMTAGSVAANGSDPTPAAKAKPRTRAKAKAKAAG